nr:cupin domain-containing protein [uncultured Albidiferax sp.]
MKPLQNFRKLRPYALLLVGLVSVGTLLAQNPGLQRTLVGRADVSVPGREAVVARVEVAPGAKAGRHTHPGDEISYVLEGEATLLVDGQPPRIIKAGESFVVPAGVVHDAHNDGAVPTRLVGVYVVEKGQPLASPAP